MFILVSLMLLSLILGILIPGVNKLDKRKKIYLFIMFSLLTLVSAFRDSSVGIDTKNYYDIFNQVGVLGLMRSFSTLSLEKGFIFLNYFINTMSFGGFQSLLFIEHLIISISVAFYIYKYSENVIISTFLYVVLVFSSTLNISRQFIAVAFVLICLHFIFKKKLSLSILFFVLAVLFHKSSAVFLPLLLFAKKSVKFNKKIFFSVLTIGVISIFAIEHLINVFINMFTKYQYYLSTDYFIRTKDISLPFLLGYVLVAVCAILLIIKDEKILEIKHEPYYINTILFLGNILCMIASSFSWLASRMIPYFQISLLVILPTTMNRLLYKDPLIRVYLYSILILIFIFYGVRSFYLDPHGLLPFSFFWEK